MFLLLCGSYLWEIDVGGISTAPRIIREKVNIRLWENIYLTKDI